MSVKDRYQARRPSSGRTGGARSARRAGLLLALLVFTAAAGAQSLDPDSSSNRQVPLSEAVQAQAADSASALPPVQETAPAAQAAPAQEAAPSAVADEPAPPVQEPLLSCGILVDGLVYDLPMPWGQEEFEKTRAAYLTSGGKKWLAVVMAQAMPYLSYVEDKVEEYGLPKELAYLPVIESEYSPQAVSTSGATGLWQFMRNSITGYGLSISEWVDDRKDFMKSTDAALKKLRDNKEALNDWLLALAAYNAGLGAVSRAVKPSGGEKALDFWQLYDSKKLSREPLSYIPKFLAVASILRYPELHGLPAEWGERGNWEAVETTRQVDMNVLSEKAGIPLGLLQAGNAELKYHITPPSASHKLKVPADKAETVRTILADDSTPLYKYDIYRVKSGDTLGEIAKGYDVALSLILQSNPGVKADRLKIGQTLIIPHIPGMAASVQPKASTAASSYTVRKGDTLWSIAVKFGMKADELAKANNFDVMDLLRVGQVLKLPKS